MNHTRILAILIFDEVEVLDFCGPFEVFWRHGRDDLVDLLVEQDQLLAPLHETVAPDVDGIRRVGELQAERIRYRAAEHDQRPLHGLDQHGLAVSQRKQARHDLPDNDAGMGSFA
jgi:hypothetical protein